MAKTDITIGKKEGKKEAQKPKKEWSDMVIKEIMFQKKMTYEEAKKHLETNHE